MAFEQLLPHHKYTRWRESSITIVQGRKPFPGSQPEFLEAMSIKDMEEARFEQRTVAKFPIDGQVISVLDKTSPHSVTDFMLRLSSAESSVVTLKDVNPSAGINLLTILYHFAQYATEPSVLEKFNLQNGFFRIMFNIDRHTSDRASVQTEKSLHPHCVIYSQQILQEGREVFLFTQPAPETEFNIVDPFIDLGSMLIEDLVISPDGPFFDPKILEGLTPLRYDPNGLYDNKMPETFHFQLPKSWDSLRDPKTFVAIAALEKQMDRAYEYIRRMFTGERETILYSPWYRPTLLPREKIVENVQQLSSVIRPEAIYKLLYLAEVLREVSPLAMERLKRVDEKLGPRFGLPEHLLLAAGNAYTLTIYSPGTVDFVREGDKWNRDAFIAVHPTLYRPFGAGGISFDPVGRLMKVERGMFATSRLSEAELQLRRKFQLGFVDQLKRSQFDK